MSRSIKVVLFAAETDKLDNGKRGRVIRLRSDFNAGEFPIIKEEVCFAYSQRMVADRTKTKYPALDIGFFAALESGLIEEVEIEVTIGDSDE